MMGRLIEQDRIKGNVVTEVEELRTRVKDLETNVVTVNGLANYSLGISEDLLGWMALLTPLSFPTLRGFWPMSSWFGAAYDISGQGRTLSAVGSPSIGKDGLLTWLALNGSSQYLTRADSVALSPSNFTIGGWFKFDNATISTAEVLISKWLTTGNQRSFQLQRNASEQIVLVVSTAGTSITESLLTGPTVADTFWHFIWARLDGSTEWAVGVDDQIVSSTSSVPSGAFDGTGAFTVGAQEGASLYLDGNVGSVFLCGTAIPDDPPMGHFELARKAWGV